MVQIAAGSPCASTSASMAWYLRSKAAAMSERPRSASAVEPAGAPRKSMWPRASLPPALTIRRSEERRVGKEGRSRCDWSSNVCSSDLGDVGEAEERFRRGAGWRAEEVDVAEGVVAAGADDQEIGRASCRERG